MTYFSSGFYPSDPVMYSDPDVEGEIFGYIESLRPFEHTDIAVVDIGTKTIEMSTERLTRVDILDVIDSWRGLYG